MTQVHSDSYLGKRFQLFRENEEKLPRVACHMGLSTLHPPNHCSLLPAASASKAQSLGARADLQSWYTAMQGCHFDAVTKEVKVMIDNSLQKDVLLGT